MKAILYACFLYWQTQVFSTSLYVYGLFVYIIPITIRQCKHFLFLSMSHKEASESMFLECHESSS
jgi:hypothetical protein